MNSAVRNGLVAIAVLLVAALLYWRFSPYEQCVRAETEELYNMWQDEGDYPADTRAEALQRAKVNCAKR
jgi:hypothetical protein